MSFDLFFCWPRKERIDFTSVCRQAESWGYFEQTDNQLWYRNEDTGVYFSLDFEAEAPADGEGPDIPEGYFDAGLSFNLNFNRPTYFGHEAMPIVERLAVNFALSVFDPQASDSEHLLLTKVNADDLLRSWLRSNRNAILTMIEHAGVSTPPQMSLEKSMYRWNYAKNKKSLEATCGEQIFVPTLSPIRRTGSGHAQLAFAYTQGVPCLVPDADWVLVVRKKKTHFWSAAESEVGVLSASRFRELAAESLRRFDSNGLSMRILPPECSSRVSKVIQTCEFEFPKQEFEVLAPDGFVDTEIDPANRPN